MKIEHIGWRVLVSKEMAGVYEVQVANNGVAWRFVTRIHSASSPDAIEVMDLIRKIFPDYEYEHLIEYRENSRTGKFEPVEDMEDYGNIFPECPY